MRLKKEKRFKKKEYLGTKAKIAVLKDTMYFNRRANWSTSQQTVVAPEHNLH